ncbi:uncharacterized protein LOC141689696 [Apium graveolens]|uniref:uncharacterized protein LOC141689696 n=1 Tax=Apium graveolens TaxID=4045 RepID=UPI003D7A9821
MDIFMRRKITVGIQEMTPRILWKNLKAERVRIFKEIIGLEQRSFVWDDWWNEDVQERVKVKQARFKELICCNEQEEFDTKKILYKEAKRLTKKIVVEAKDKACEEMYIGLSTNEGANGIYKLAKAQERRQRDFGFVRFIKDENARVLVKDDDIKCRWYHYFRQIFNESRISGEEIEWESVRQSHCDSNIQPINGEEIELALMKMGKGKATGPDEIPIEVWWCLGKEGER